MAGEKNFGSSVLDFIDKVAESGKKGFRAAGDAISDFGDKSVIRIELGQLKSSTNLVASSESSTTRRVM